MATLFDRLRSTLTGVPAGAYAFRREQQSLALRAETATLAVMKRQVEAVENYADAALIFQDRYADGFFPVGGYWGASARKGGRDAPNLLTDFDHEYERTLSRHLARTNDYYGGLIEALVAYEVGKGFAWQCHQVGTVFDATQTIDDPRILSAQADLDAFRRRDKWTLREEELCRRSHRDGEAILRLFRSAPGRPPAARAVEPEWIAKPNGAGSTEGPWSFGVLTHPDDVEKPLAYHVRNPATPAADGEVVLAGGLLPDEETEARELIERLTPGLPIGAGRIYHLKRSVDRTVKRGTPTLFAAANGSSGALKLLNNIVDTATLQAAIYLIRQHVGGSTASVTNFASNFAASGTVKTPAMPGSTGGVRVNNVPAASQRGAHVIDSSDATNYLPGPTSGGVPGFLAAQQAALRKGGVRVGAPEYLTTGDASNGNYACHDAATELLTKRGWRKWNEIQYGDEAGTMNPNTQEFEWQKIEAIHQYEHQGDMIRFSGSHDLDMLVTPNHRMYVSQHQHRRHGGRAGKMARVGLKPYQFVRADEVRPGSVLPFACKPKRGVAMESVILPPRKRYSTGPRHIPTEPMLRYIGWWVSEGWALSKGWPYTIGICQSAQKTAFVENIRDTVAKVSECGVAIRENTLGNGMVAWQSTDQALWSWLRQNAGRGSYSKRLPEFINELPAGQLDTLLETLIHGDGNRRESGSAGYYTVSRELADQVQSVGIQCGYVCHVKKTMANGVLPVALKRPGRVIKVSKRHISRVPYRGVVWCVTVPNGLAITRRNGKSAVTGNSTKEAGSPFVVMTEMRQKPLAAFEEDVAYGVLELMGTDAAGICVTVTPPAVAIRSELDVENQRAVQHQNGVLSATTWQKQAGLQPEVEAANFAKEREASMDGEPPLVLPGMFGAAS